MIHVRPYTAADRAACLAVYDSNVPAYFLPEERPAYAAFLDALPGPYLVLEAEDERVVACGGYAVKPGTTTADMCWGMVVQDLHRTGLGWQLLQARLARVRADPGVTDIALNTSQHTWRFYARVGFQTERITPDGYAGGLHRYDMRMTCAAPAALPEM